MLSEKKKLLLVEDEAMLAMGQKRDLEKYGYDVRFVASGEEAIEACSSASDIDLILMDINLGAGMDGTEAANIILQAHDLPLIFLSSHTEKEVVIKTEKITPYGYVIKNSGMAVLDTSIKMAFKLHDANRKLFLERDRFQATLNSIAEAVIAMDKDGKVSHINPVAEKLIGVGVAQMQGRTLDELAEKISDKKILTDMLHDFTDSINRDVCKEFSIYLNGADRRLSVSASPIRDKSNVFTGIVLAIRDISEEFKAREDLRFRESYLRAIIENQPGLVWLKDTQSRFLAVNQAFLTACGLSALDQIAGKTDFDIWPHDLADKYRSDDKLVIETNTPRIEEEPILAQGDLTWFETFKAPILNAEGECIGTTGYSRDITERKKNELSREISERRYRTLIDLAVDGIIVMSADGVIIEVNEFMCKMIGVDRNRIMGLNISAFPFTSQCLEKYPLNYQSLNADQIESCERVLLNTDGTQVPVEMRSKLMPDGTYQSIFRDISDKKKAETDLRTKTMFLEAVVNSSADGILVIDPMGQKIFQNQRTIELWKLDPAVANDPDGSKQVEHVMKMTKNPKQFFDEIEHQKKFPYEVNIDSLELTDGTVLHRHSSPVVGTDQRLYGRIYHFHDITSFRQAEERIRGLLAEKETILREVHHRVKNYMSTLSGLLTLQSATVTDSAALGALEDAQSRIQSMMYLYDKLYVSDGSENKSLGRYLPSLVDEIMGNFPKKALVTVDKHVDDFMLGAKTLQLIGMIVNELLTNIMKYAFEDKSTGHVILTARKRENEVILSVSDDGIGLPANVDFKTSKGFGLMLVDTLVHQLGGTVSVERDKGTTVTIKFIAE
jgi:PAS domain S-box-containing protein